MSTDNRMRLGDSKMLGHKCFLSAKMLLLDYMFLRPADIEAIQALNLLSLYFLHIENEDASYKAIGIAIRLAYEMGLHLCSRESGHSNQEIDTRRRTWWCLYLLDRRTSVSLGRPWAINDKDLDVSFPTPYDDLRLFPEQIKEPGKLEQSKIPYLIEFVKFSSIVGGIYEKIYGIHSTWPPDVSIVQGLDDSLERWRCELPPFLRFQQERLQQLPSWLAKQQLFLHMVRR